MKILLFSGVTLLGCFIVFVIWNYFTDKATYRSCRTQAHTILVNDTKIHINSAGQGSPVFKRILANEGRDLLEGLYFSFTLEDCFLKGLLKG